jgi:predicted metal-dependent HD superfamily phosphohydrolase
VNAQEQIDTLKRSWNKIAWTQPEHSCVIGFDAILGRYQQPGRHYHDLRHLIECLEHQEIERARNPTAVLLALFFHDYVYDTRSHAGNEERSANVLSKYIAPWLKNASDAFIACHHIMATEKHQIATNPVPETIEDSKLVIDCDLSILGRPMDRYAQYESDIQLEYGHVPSEIFKKRRGEIMIGFLGREHLYFNESFKERYEAQARKNISIYWSR